jgi:hypothetical protein
LPWPATLRADPIITQRLHQLGQRAQLLIVDQIFDRQQRIDRGGVGDRFKRDEVQLRAALRDILARSAQPLSGRRDRAWDGTGRAPARNLIYPAILAMM